MKTYLTEIKYEFLSALRTPRYSVSTVLFPAMFYVFFGIVMRQGHGGGDEAYTARTVMTAMSAMGVMLASLWGPGAGIAFERGMGWLEVKRASPMPPLAYFLAKIANAMLFSSITIIVVFTLAATLGGVHMGLDRWALLAASLVAGSIPFSALGFLIGYTATPNTAPAMVNMIVLPMSFLSGLWIPLQFLPKVLRDFAVALPAYHLNQIATMVAGLPSRGTLGSHIEGLLAATLLLGGFAWIAWRRDDRKVFG
jgi:ABC-2 type transport system permease protein